MDEISRGVTILEIPVTMSSDDAEEYHSSWSDCPKHHVDLGSSDLELIWDGLTQTVGMRFISVMVPKNAIIKKAYIQFQCDDPSSKETSLVISGELTGNSETFQSIPKNISKRKTTKQVVVWEPPAWTHDQVQRPGPEQRTPDISKLIQEIVDQRQWKAGNAIAIIINGEGKRSAESYDGEPHCSPLLHIEYENKFN